MGQLFFKKPLQAAIREGRKRTTIRRWDRPRLRAGDRAYAPGVGWLAIEAVEPVDLATLGDEDARADGFDSAELLCAALRSFYPDHGADGRAWFRVCFRLSDPERPRRRRSAEGHPGLF